MLGKNYISALQKVEKLQPRGKREKVEKQQEIIETEIEEEKEQGENQEIEEGIFPKELRNRDLERQYIGILLKDPRLIKKYFYLYEECNFEDPELLNIYKSILFTEGGAYTSEVAKKGFSFAQDNERSFELKSQLKREIKEKSDKMEKIYIDLKKLFVLRRNYLAIPIQNIQEKVIEIKSYELYDKMSVEEVENAVIQVNDTEKFKRAIISEGLTDFLQLGDNNLTNAIQCRKK